MSRHVKAMITVFFLFCFVFYQATSKKKNGPNTYVGLLGTQPSKDGNKETNKNKSRDPVSALSLLELRFIPCEHRSAAKNSFSNSHQRW